MTKRPRNSAVTVRSIETGEVIRIEGRRNIPEPVKRAVWARDGLCCRYCGFWSGEDVTKFELDHVHPVSLGGQNTAANLVVACRRCNRMKGTEAGWTPMSSPDARNVRRTRHWMISQGKKWNWRPQTGARNA